MGFGKERNRIRKQIPSWKCKGYFGYGHGRGVREWGDKPLKEKSVCLDLCEQSEACRRIHHAKMDLRFPAVADIVYEAARVAHAMGRPVVPTVAAAVTVAENRKVKGTEEIRRTLNRLRVMDMVDHYVCGQFENIQNGLDGVAPDAPCSLHEEKKKSA